MNLAEWQKTFKRGEWSGIIPVFKIDENNKAEDIINELERLGFFSGNMCAGVKDANYIDVWYSDFYNTFHIYTMHEEAFLSSLCELKALNPI